MGIGTLNVLILHLYSFNNLHIPFVAYFLGNLVHVSGFMLLSGYGLYYSLSKDLNVANFVKRRLKRLFFPYFVIVLPFYLYFFFADPMFGFIELLTNLLGIGYWINGGVSGNWYVSMSLFLYLIFPLLFKFIFTKDEKIICRLFFTCFLFFSIFGCIYLMAPLYFETIRIGVYVPVIFVIGSYWGYLACNNVQVVFSLKQFVDFKLLLIFFMLISFSLYIFPSYVRGYYSIFLKMFTLPITCFVLKCLNKNIDVISNICKLLNWLGTYSLPIYLLHLLFYDFFRCIFNIHTSFWFTILAFALSFLLAKPVELGTRKVSRILFNNTYFNHN